MSKKDPLSIIELIDELDRLHVHFSKSRDLYAKEYKALKKKYPDAPLTFSLYSALEAHNAFIAHTHLTTTVFRGFLTEMIYAHNELANEEETKNNDNATKRVSAKGTGNRNLSGKGRKERNLPGTRTRGGVGGSSRKGKKVAKRQGRSGR